MSHVAGPIAPDAWVQNARRGRTNPKLSGTQEMPSRVSSRQLDDLSARLSLDDLRLIAFVAAGRLARGEQIARVFSVGEWSEGRARVIRRRLEQFTEWRLLDRLPRAVGGPTGGSSGWIYCLGPAGIRLMTRHGVITRRTRAPGARFTDHTIAVLEVVVLLAEAHRRGDLEFLGWDGEPDCWREYRTGFSARHVLRPDLFVRVGAGDLDEDVWDIEVDRGTESLPTVVSKCRRYIACARSPEAHRVGVPRVLWIAPNPERAERIREAIRRLPEGDRQIFSVANFPDAVPLIASEAHR